MKTMRQQMKQGLNANWLPPLGQTGVWAIMFCLSRGFGLYQTAPRFKWRLRSCGPLPSPPLLPIHAGLGRRGWALLTPA